MADDVSYCFEQPLNERIRTFLRIEHLAARFHHHADNDSLWGRRATVDAVLDLLNVMSRHDIRGEVSKALGQRRATLAPLAEREDIDSQALAALLAEIDGISADMTRIAPQFASYLLRDEDVLASVNNRNTIPGGTCSFDLPGYHHWLGATRERVQTDIARWVDRVLPIEQGVALLLRLLRESGQVSPQTASHGVLVHQGANATQLIRVFLMRDDVFPEISAGRHRTTIRFMAKPASHSRLRQSDDDIDFQLATCRF